MLAEADYLFGCFSFLLKEPKHLNNFDIDVLEHKRRQLRILTKNLPLDYLQSRQKEYKTLLNRHRPAGGKYKTLSYVQSITDILLHQIKIRTPSGTISGNPHEKSSEPTATKTMQHHIPSSAVKSTIQQDTRYNKIQEDTTRYNKIQPSP